MATRTINVDALARVEGEGALTIRYKKDRVEEVSLRIFEPPRFFEALLRGRDQREAPDVTARICGICPVAYQMSACHAIEAAHGMKLPPPIRALRRLLYCGEWLESHVLHIVMLHAPDFLGVDDAIQMADAHPDTVTRALRMKKAGNAIVRALGGREIHPVNVRVGGFHRAPTKAELSALLPELRWAKSAAIDLLHWVRGFSFPELSRDVEMVALVHPLEYALNEGRIASTKGLDIAVADYEQHFAEEHVARSNALHSRRTNGQPYLCGPLARFNLSFERLPTTVQEVARSIGVVPPVLNPFHSILVRGLETLFAFEEAIAIIEAYSPPTTPFVEVPIGKAKGHAVTEAPRGLLFHRYEVDDAGLIVDAKIVPPTSQNQATIEDDLRALAPELLAMSPAEAQHRAEHAIRNYDPCISCATHFLTLKLEESA